MTKNHDDLFEEWHKELIETIDLVWGNVDFDILTEVIIGRYEHQENWDTIETLLEYRRKYVQSRKKKD